MTDLEDTNEVLMDEIAKAIEIHLGEEVGFILGCKQAWREAIHPYVRKQMEKNGNSNINGVVFFEKKILSRPI